MYSWVLQIHGKCLRSLIWDERKFSRHNLKEDHAHLDNDHNTLKLIAKPYPGLKALEVPLDWKDIMRSG